MRHELILASLVLLVLIIDLNLKKSQKTRIIPIAISMFFIHTVVGFLPAQTGVLFGGMYHTEALTILMKNILLYPQGDLTMQLLEVKVIQKMV